MPTVRNRLPADAQARRYFGTLELNNVDRSRTTYSPGLSNTGTSAIRTKDPTIRTGRPWPFRPISSAAREGRLSADQCVTTAWQACSGVPLNSLSGKGTAGTNSSELASRACCALEVIIARMVERPRPPIGPRTTIHLYEIHQHTAPRSLRWSR
jgi:hypothetical protein